MRTDELYDRLASVSIFKETPSQEKHKTSSAFKQQLN
jgi:hypothetical protein